MLKFLMSFYSKHRKNKIIQFLKKVYTKEYAFPDDYLAAFRLAKIKKKEKNTNRNIRIGFIVQDPSIWSKTKRLYIAMKKHSKFDVFLICVPNPFDKDSGSTYEFLHARIQDCIDARIGEGPWNILNNQGEWYDMKSLNLDYIYYGQPYNNYLPKAYRNTVTSKYSRVCVMTYGMTMSWNFLKMHPRYFHRYVYCCYAATREELTFNQQRFPLFYKFNLQKTKYLGFPAFDDIFECREDEAPSWKFSKNEFRVIWTPRWVTDEKLGGSNFFRYKDALFDYASVHKDVDFLFRPHPMALDNFIETGEMTVDEVSEFKEKCTTMDNVNLDIQKDYNATIWKSSVLISDISSIIVEYFITGKPIIFCDTLKSEQNYLEYFSKILSCCYIVNNEKELLDTLSQLKSFVDPLKEKRQKMIDELFGKILHGSTDRIVKDFLNDYYGENEYYHYSADLLKKIHEYNLNILYDFVLLCKKYDIKYFAYAGTLLGAIRHQGFIPWDDDIDIGMLREDYEKFLAIPETEYSDKYYICAPEKDSHFHNFTPRLVLKNSEWVTEMSRHCGTNMGLHIELFVFENIKKRKKIPHITHKVILLNELIVQVFNQKVLTPPNLPHPYIRRIIKRLINLYLKIFKVDINKVIRLYQKTVQEPQKTEYVTQFSYCPLSEKSTMKVMDIFPTNKMNFENISISTPKESKKLLEQLYGKDYMKLPPKEKRTNHIPVAIRFPGENKIELDHLIDD